MEYQEIQAWSQGLESHDDVAEDDMTELEWMQIFV